MLRLFDAALLVGGQEKWYVKRVLSTRRGDINQDITLSGEHS